MYHFYSNISHKIHPILVSIYSRVCIHTHIYIYMCRKRKCKKSDAVSSLEEIVEHEADDDASPIAS